MVEPADLRPPQEAGRSLVMVRHGETAWNAEGRAQGHADVPLSEVGHRQAEVVAPALASFEPARLWSSDLARALQTAEHVAAATRLPIEPDARLREYDVGKRSGLTLEEFAAAFPEEYAAWLAEDPSRLVPGEETTEQVRDRVVPALRDCLASLAPGQTGIVVLHGACLKVGLMGLLGWSWELSRTLHGVENCAYSVLSEHEVRGGLRLTSYNEKAVGSRHGPDFVSDGPVG
ncbi:MAG TPA: histidine phosphatase family protein [Actinomycetes bacterium]|nr:histidine phosphatase family protein [Actinomycetes bacterium]